MLQEDRDGSGWWECSVIMGQSLPEAAQEVHHLTCQLEEATAARQSYIAPMGPV